MVRSCFVSLTAKKKEKNKSTLTLILATPKNRFWVVLEERGDGNHLVGSGKKNVSDHNHGFQESMLRAREEILELSLDLGIWEKKIALQK